jgi:AraC-like DNA-binding protein
VKGTNNIPTLPSDGYKSIMAYYDAQEYSKKNIRDFYIHGLADDTYELKMPLPPHRQANHSILLVTNGSLTTSSGSDNYTVDQSALIVVPAGQITSLSFMSDDIQGFYLHFSAQYLPNPDLDFSDWLLRPVLRFDKTELRHLTTLLQRMQQLNESEANAAVVKAYLATFLSEMKQAIDAKTRINFSAHERIAFGFKKLLAQHISRRNSLHFYANELNITPNHLNKSIKIALGRSASSLTDELLVLEAKVLMQKAGLDIGGIAFELGFDDASYFGRFFKKHTGFTPKEYRRTIELSD